MKKNISLFIKGVVLGIAFIIPGVSGGTLAVLLGIYEELIEAVTNFYKSFANLKKYFMFLLPIGLGALTSLLLCAKLIEYGLSKAVRPFNSRLDKSKLVENGFEPLPTWDDALSRYLKEQQYV